MERNQGQIMPADSGFATPVIDPEFPLKERTGEVEGELNGMFDSTYFDNWLRSNKVSSTAMKKTKHSICPHPFSPS